MKIKIFLLLIATFSLYSFSFLQEENFVTDVIKKFVVRSRTQPQEKVYLHTDRETYDAGERIWFRAYLQDAMTHQPSIYSQFVYVELTDRENSVLQRVKIRQRDTIYFGYIDLKESLPQGEYFLRAYSYWMQNMGEEYLFRKKILISNMKENKVVYNVTYEKKGEGYVARLHFNKRDGDPYKGITVFHAFSKENQENKERQTRTDDNGEIVIPFKPEEGYTSLSLRFSENAPIMFKRVLAVPEYTEDYEIQFFPEGGDLIPGAIQKIAFKAIGKDGLSREIKGNIVNSAGEVLTPFESTHKGMGLISLMAMPEEKYYAVTKSADGIEKKFDLPMVKKDGMALQILYRGNTLVYSVLTGSEAIVPKNLYLVAHTRGRILAADPLEGRNQGALSTEGYPEGILHLSLVDENNNVYSQRLQFIRNKNKNPLNISTDKKGYSNREKVNLSISNESAQSGSFSLTVIPFTEEDSIKFFKNILSELLLTSDLKGYIEEPAYYFQEENLNVLDYNLDILMLTQGWTRFDISKFLKGEEKDGGEYFLERGQAVSGKVLNLWGKDAENAQLTLISSNYRIFENTKTDSQGNFIVDGISFQDGIQFVVQAKNQRGRRNVEVQLDKDEFLAPRTLEPYGIQYKQDEDKFLEKYNAPYYMENGVRVYVLEEVTVEARAKPVTVEDIYRNMARYHMDSARIADMDLPDIRLLLETLPGIRVEDTEEGEIVTRNGNQVMVVIDDFVEENMAFLFMLQPREIASISYMASIEAASLWGGNMGGNGAIIVTTDKNYVRGATSRPNMNTFTPLGYQKAEEFYIPAYEVDSIRIALQNEYDGRKTIYWNPGVEIQAGKTTPLSFYTADGNKHHKVILEGILEDGTIYRKEMDF